MRTARTHTVHLELRIGLNSSSGSLTREFSLAAGGVGLRYRYKTSTSTKLIRGTRNTGLGMQKQYVYQREPNKRYSLHEA